MDDFKNNNLDLSKDDSTPPPIPTDDLTNANTSQPMTKKELKANQKAQKAAMKAATISAKQNLKAQKKAYKASQPFYKKWWFWLIVIVVIVGVFGSRGKKDKDTSSTSVTTTTSTTTSTSAVSNEPQPSSTPSKNQVYGVGETVDINGLKFTINSAINTDEADMVNSSSTLKEGNTYEIIDITLENTTDKDVAISSVMSFTLKDEDGRNCSYLFSWRDNGQLDGTILPGDKLSGELLYEVPRNGELNLFFKPSVFEKDIKFKVR